jgi:hypothetical protein
MIRSPHLPSRRVTRPAQGHRAVPHDFDITFFAPDPYYVKQHPSELTWPRDLPLPASDLVPAQCDLGAGREGCRYAVNARYREPADRLDRIVSASEVPLIVLVNGKRFMISVDGRYRGERSIDALIFCAARFSHNPMAI